MSPLLALPTVTPTAPRAGLPMTTPEAAALDIIFIEGLRVSTVIGIDASELHQPQPLLIDLHAGVPHAPACESDQIGDTIHYGVVRTRILELMAQHGVQLLEALAEKLADTVLHEFGAAWVRVRIAKPHKFEDLQAVGVIIERRAPKANPLPAAPTPSGQGSGNAVLRLIGTGMVPGPTSP